jgi:hypothetical protein
LFGQNQWAKERWEIARPPLGCSFGGAICHLPPNQPFISKPFIVNGSVAILHFNLGNIHMRPQGVVEMIVGSEVDSELRC